MIAKAKLIRWMCVTACVAGGVGIVAGLVLAIIAHRIRAELAAVVRDQLHAELKDADVSYRPPYGAVLRDVRIVKREPDGRERDLFTASRLDLRLEKRPRSGGGPVLIRALELRDPVVHWVANEGCVVVRWPARPATPQSQPGIDPDDAPEPEPPVVWCPPSAGPEFPAKLSDKVQVRNLRVEGGSLHYEDRARPDRPPLVLAGIRLDVQPPARPGAEQSFTLAAGGDGARIETHGAIDPDSLVLSVTKVAADLRVLGRGTAGSALPGPVVEAARRYRLGGAAQIAGHGRFPLRALEQSTFEAAAEVRDGTAGAPGAESYLDQIHLRASLDSGALPTEAAPAGAVTRPSSSPATRPSAPTSPALHVKLAALEARGGENTIVVTAGEFWRDPAKGIWKVAGLAGHIQTPASAMDAPARASARPPPFGAVAQPVAMAPAATTRPTRPRGRVDFTAAASGPTQVPPGKVWSDVVRYELIAFPREAVWRPGRKWPLPIEHLGGGGSIRAADGVITFRDLTGTYGGDRIDLKAARIPLPRRDLSQLWRRELRIEEMIGTLTCYQPGPAYPPGVEEVFAALHPAGTFTLGGRITLRRQPGIKDDFHVEVTADGRGAFTVTEHRLPLAQVRGRATIDSGLGVVIDPTEARTLGGTLTAQLVIGSKSKSHTQPGAIDAPTTYEGKAWLRGVDMALLAQALDLRGVGERVQRLSGRGFMDVQFAGVGSGGPVPPARALRADGELQILGCHFWDDPVLGKVASGVRTSKQAGDGDAAAVFSVADGKVTIREAAINSPSLGVEGSGTITFDKRLDLQLVAVPIGDLRDRLKQSNVPILGEAAGEFVGLLQDLLKGTTGALLYQYRVTGPATNPTETVVPAPVLSDPAAAIFGDMLRGNRDERLIDAVRTRSH